MPLNARTSGGPASMKATKTRIRWNVMFMVFLIVTVSYLDRTNLSVAAPTLQQ